MAAPGSTEVDEHESLPAVSDEEVGNYQRQVEREQMSEKREMKAMEVEIHSGDENPIDALMKADLEDRQPHQG